MPVLSVYFGFSAISLLAYQDADEFEFFHFPYVYEPELFSTYLSEDDFNKTVLETLLKPTRKKLSSFDLISSGFLRPKAPSDTAKLAITLPDILSSIEKADPVFVNGISLMTKNDFICHKNILGNLDSQRYVVRDREMNYYSNSAIHSQLTSTEISHIIEVDQILLEMLDGGSLTINSQKPVLFVGPRFATPLNRNISNYILMLSLITKPGIYELLLDDKNAILLTQLLKIYMKQTVLNIYDVVESVGTLVSTDGYTECMVKTDVGTSQLLEIQKDTVFIMPLNKDTSADILVKNHELGIVEKRVSGGSLGLIIDTRTKKGDLAKDVRLINNLIHQIEVALRKI